KKIPTPKDRYWVEVEGDIENKDNVLKITQIRANYHIKTPRGKEAEAREALSSYIKFCPAAQSVIGCIEIKDEAVIEEMD
ncbi:MAG: OsmC family protein, partial [Pseudomonadota bacterium]